MGFLSLLLALLIEQARPVSPEHPVYAWVRKSADQADRFLHASEDWRYGAAAWGLVVLVWCLLTLSVWALAKWVAGPLGGVISIVVLYFTLNFHQFSHRFTDIQLALNQGDTERARWLLEQWKQESDPTCHLPRMPDKEVIRQAIEHALILAHRQVFAVMFWFLVLPGPVGAVLYRVADQLARQWGESRDYRHLSFGLFSLQARDWLDWLPARITALGFAAAGQFEEAMLAWRNQRFESARSLLLATGLGALGIRWVKDHFEDVVHVGDKSKPRGDSGKWMRFGTRNDTRADLRPDPKTEPRSDTRTGHPHVPIPEPETTWLAATVGLLWRAVIVWLGVLLLVTLGGVLR